MDAGSLEWIASFVIAAADGSHVGLHELPGQLASRLPGLDAAQIVAGCRSAVAELVERGFISLRVTPAHSARPTRDDYLPVDSDEVSRILEDPKSWDHPSEARPRYWVWTTPEGLAEYVKDVVSL